MEILTEQLKYRFEKGRPSCAVSSFQLLHRAIEMRTYHREWLREIVLSVVWGRAGTCTWLLSHMDLLIQRAVIPCLGDTLHHRGLTYFTCVALNLLLLSEPSELILIQFPRSIMQGRKWSHFMLTVSSAGWENLMAEMFIFTGTVVVTVFLQIMGRGRGFHCPTRACVHWF